MHSQAEVSHNRIDPSSILFDKQGLVKLGVGNLIGQEQELTNTITSERQHLNNCTETIPRPHSSDEKRQPSRLHQVAERVKEPCHLEQDSLSFQELEGKSFQEATGQEPASPAWAFDGRTTEQDSSTIGTDPEEVSFTCVKGLSDEPVKA